MKSKKIQIFFIAISLITALFIVILVTLEKKKKTKTENPAEEIASGWNQFRMGEHNQALKFFNKALKAAPEKSEFQIQALYGIGITQSLKLPNADKPAAEMIFNDIIVRFPESDYAVWSMLALVRMKHIVPSGEIPDYPPLRTAYRKIYDKFPNHIAGQEAFIYLIETYLAVFTIEDAKFAKASLGEFLKKHPDSSFTGTAWSLYARACETLGQKQEQLDAMIKGLENKEIDPTNPKMENSTSFWSIAVVAEFEAGDFDTARKYYRRLMNEYPRDMRNFGAKTAIDRMNALEEKLRLEK
ncbi:MAG: tetratricopeptide repeat protein [Victivallales bacterium]|jgi:tetratricopeptide (TPR) repeat protein